MMDFMEFSRDTTRFLKEAQYLKIKKKMKTAQGNESQHNTHNSFTPELWHSLSAVVEELPIELNNPDSDPDPYSNPDPDSDPNSNIDSNLDFDPDFNPDPNPDPDSFLHYTTVFTSFFNML